MRKSARRIVMPVMYTQDDEPMVRVAADGPGPVPPVAMPRADRAAADHVLATPRWSAVVPFFNEADYLPATIASLAAQTRAVRLILVDNASTDGSADIARAACVRHGVDYLLVREPRAGKVHALATGLRWVATELVATCDADTLYPTDYLGHAETLLDRPGTVAAGAYFVPADVDAARLAREGRRIRLTTALLRRQCHTGGAGQAFRTAALRAAGGFDAATWNYVLEDHEVIHRVLHLGRMGYAADFWCAPSPRERDRASIRWTLTERLLYAATAPFAGDWFFYRFLAARLAGRRLSSDRIRERGHHDEGSSLGAAYALCG